MSDDVKPPRSYDAQGRRRRAAQTRAAVLRTARELLLTQGYAATTIPQVAAEAGVSPEFVYKNVGGRAALLAAVLDVAVAGDDEPVPLIEREAMLALRAERDARAVIRGYVAVMVAVQQRTAPLLLLAAQAVGDAGAAGVLAKSDAERLVGMGALAAHLRSTGQIRAGLDQDRVRDELWALTGVGLYDALVLRRGWSVPDYGSAIERWMGAAVLDAGQA